MVREPPRPTGYWDRAGATFEDPSFRLVAKWLEALVAVDQREAATAEGLFGALIELDDVVDTSQQADLLADQVILEVRRTREKEGVACRR